MISTVLVSLNHHTNANCVVALNQAPDRKPPWRLGGGLAFTYLYPTYLLVNCRLLGLLTLALTSQTTLCLFCHWWCHRTSWPSGECDSPRAMFNLSGGWADGAPYEWWTLVGGFAGRGKRTPAKWTPTETWSKLNGRLSKAEVELLRAMHFRTCLRCQATHIVYVHAVARPMTWKECNFISPTDSERLFSIPKSSIPPLLLRINDDKHFADLGGQCHILHYSWRTLKGSIFGEEWPYRPKYDAVS